MKEKLEASSNSIIDMIFTKEIKALFTLPSDEFKKPTTPKKTHSL